MRSCHQDVTIHLRGSALVFWVFHLIGDYAATLADRVSAYASDLQVFPNIAKALEAEAGPRYQAMKCASLLREKMWSVVSELTSDLYVDCAA